MAKIQMGRVGNLATHDVTATEDITEGAELAKTTLSLREGQIRRNKKKPKKPAT